MPIAVEIKVDSAQMLRLETELKDIKNGVPRAIMSAINKTVSQGRTVAVNGLAEVLTVKKNNIRGRTSVKKATMQRLAGAVVIEGKRIGLINFKYKDTGRGRGRNRRGKGVFVQAYKAGSPQQFPRAFVAVGKSGNKHIFQRRGKAGRLPIDSLKGLSLLETYKTIPGLVQKTQAKIMAVFDEKLRSATDWLLNRSKGERPQ